MENMNCKKCGAPLTPADLFCRNCGAAVEEVNAQINEEVNDVNYVEKNNVSSQNYGNSMPINNGYAQTSEQNATYPTQQVVYKKKNNVPIIVGIVAVAVVVLSIILVPMILNGNNVNNGTNNGNGGNDNETPLAVATYKVNFAGFTLSVPDDIVYKVSGETLMFSDENGSWIAELNFKDLNYNKIRSNRVLLQGFFETGGLNVKPAELKSFNNKEYITLEAIEKDTNVILGITRINSIKCAVVAVYNLDNTFDYDLLKKISSIIASAKYDDASNSISVEPEINFDLDGLSELEK